jgi:hypothetical protein
VAEHFRVAIRREKEPPYLVDLPVQPVRSAALWFAHVLAAMHHGRINAYSAYVLLADLGLVQRVGIQQKSILNRVSTRRLKMVRY